MRALSPAVVTLLMFAVVGGLVVAYVAKSMFAREEVAPQVENRMIPMAVVDIEPGTLMSEEHLGEGPYPADQLDRDVLTSTRVIVGRVAKTKISAATPIRAGELYQPGEYPDLQLEPEMRAVSVEVGSSTALVDGLVKPDQFVDVHFTVDGSGDERRGGGLTMRLFKGVRVLAINRQIRPGTLDRAGNRVTLEVTEEQANILILAREKGTLTLSYNPNGRGSGGVDVSDRDRATLEEILGLKPIEKPEPPFVTEIFSQGSRQVNRFRDGRYVDGFMPTDGENQPYETNSYDDRSDAAGQRDAGDAEREVEGPSAALAFPPRR